MRMHIELDDRVMARIDKIAGPRGRSGFVRRAIEMALDQHERWELILSAAGSITSRDHPWDTDSSGWVRSQRRSDQRRAG